MGMNPIGDEGVESILKGVEQNSSLRLVGLEVKQETLEKNLKFCNHLF